MPHRSGSSQSRATVLSATTNAAATDSGPAALASAAPPAPGGDHAQREADQRTEHDPAQQGGFDYGHEISGGS